MAGGRPSKYDPKYCEHIVEWFSSMEDDPKKCPLFGRYAVEIGVVKSTLHEWCKNHPEFSAAYSQAKSIQESIMIERGLNGEFNGGFTKFAMSNMHGWTERSEQSIDVQNFEFVEDGE